MQLAYSTWGMPHVPPEVALPALRDVGYDALELTVTSRQTYTDVVNLGAGARRQIRALLRDTGLRLASVSGHSSLLMDDPARLQTSLERLRASVDLCVELAMDDRPPSMTTTAGGRPDEWEQVREMLAERFGVLAEYARGRGVVVAVEPHVGQALDLPEKALWLLDRVDSPHLALTFDISHFDVMGLSIGQSVEPLVRHSVHTHVKDQRRRPAAVPAADSADPGAIAADGWHVPGNGVGRCTGPDGTTYDYQFLIPGEGDFDYVEYLRQMARASYDGAITVEVSVQVQARPDYDPFAGAALAYRTLVDAFQRSGAPRNGVMEDHLGNSGHPGT
jgi:sugar phosphate isomerase/epimerase